MPRFYSGDVILVLFPFKDGIGAKKRPAVVIREDSLDEYLICQITSKNRSNEFKGFWVEKESEEGKKMRLLQDSFINAENYIVVRGIMIDKKIGTCPYIGKLEMIIDELEENE